MFTDWDRLFFHPVDQTSRHPLHRSICRYAQEGAEVAPLPVFGDKAIPILIVFGTGHGYHLQRLVEEYDIWQLINPVLTPLSDELEEVWEGCLSVPGMRGMVPRYKQLRYSGFDQYGNVIDRTVGGFHARVVQHECDHLMGILYPLRIRDMRRFGFTDVLFPSCAPPEE